MINIESEIECFIWWRIRTPLRENTGFNLHCDKNSVHFFLGEKTWNIIANNLDRNIHETIYEAIKAKPLRNE